MNCHIKQTTATVCIFKNDVINITSVVTMTAFDLSNVNNDEYAYKTV